MDTYSVNWLAILVCGVVSILLGSIWYGALFGKVWMAYMKVTPEQAKNFPKSQMIKSYVIAFISSLLMAFTLSNILTYGGALAPWQGAVAGFFQWLGFVVPVALSGVLWENKPWKIFWITAGYYLVYLAIIGVILVAWK
jgi:hypothetical protein